MADQRSFDGFYLGTRAQLLRHLTLMTGDAEEAADVLQEAYARAWVRWDRVSGLESPAAWPTRGRSTGSTWAPARSCCVT